jgi:hypothetical protein
MFKEEEVLMNHEKIFQLEFYNTFLKLFKKYYYIL